MTKPKYERPVVQDLFMPIAEMYCSNGATNNNEGDCFTGNAPGTSTGRCTSGYYPRNAGYCFSGTGDDGSNLCDSGTGAA